MSYYLRDVFFILKYSKYKYALGTYFFVWTLKKFCIFNTFFYNLILGKHTATVACKNKRDGKQRASQAILQALHPSITSWGSLLRLYGNRSVKSFKEKKMEEQEITSLQSKAAVNQPNHAILNKLKIELSKLREKRKAIKPIGILDTEGAGGVTTLSTSNLKNLDLWYK